MQTLKVLEDFDDSEDRIGWVDIPFLIGPKANSLEWHILNEMRNDTYFYVPYSSVSIDFSDSLTKKKLRYISNHLSRIERFNIRQDSPLRG